MLSDFGCECSATTPDHLQYPSPSLVSKNTRHMKQYMENAFHGHIEHLWNMQVAKLFVLNRITSRYLANHKMACSVV